LIFLDLGKKAARSAAKIDRSVVARKTVGQSPPQRCRGGLF
jgi:hypothetical protein